MVIASSADEYLRGAKARPDAAGQIVEFELGGVSWQASPEIVTYADNFRYLADNGAGFASWRERAKRRRDLNLATSIPALAGDYPDYLVGAIATGDIVSAAEAFARWLRQANRFRVAIEMEAGGAARAIYQDSGAKLIVVRGISDRSDERKDDMDATTGSRADSGSWRKYAMHNAVDLFATLLVNPHFPWPTPAEAGLLTDHRRSESGSVPSPAGSKMHISVPVNNSQTTFIGETKIGDLKIGGSGP